MKASIFAGLALASSAIAIPTSAIDPLNTVLEAVPAIPVNNVLDGLPVGLLKRDSFFNGVLEAVPARNLLGGLLADSVPVDGDLPLDALPLRVKRHKPATGHVVQDLGEPLREILIITGLDTKELLIELSPAVAELLDGLGLPELGGPVGHVVKSASSLGDLVADLGEPIKCLVTVVGGDLGYLLIELSEPVASLLYGLGLPTLAEPIGEVLETVGENLKRSIPSQGLIADLAPIAGCILRVTGIDTKTLLIKLSDPVGQLLAGLGLTGLAGPVQRIIKSAGTVGDLIKDLACPVERLLIVVGEDGKLLLIELSTPVAELLAGLGLSPLAGPVGEIVGVVGETVF